MQIAVRCQDGALNIRTKKAQLAALYTNRAISFY